MVGNMTKDQFDPQKNYNHFYENHKFEPFPEEYVTKCHEILPRAGWALDTAIDNDYKTFIDLCCLDGFVALTLAEQAGMSGIGIDLSDPGIELATKRAESHNLPVTFVKTAGEDFPFDAKTDMVMMFEAVEHFTDTPAVLKQYTSYLNPGGSLLISTPDAEGFYGIGNDDACHLRYYSYRRESEWGDLTREWEGRPILSLPELIESLGGKVEENQVWNELIHLRATF